MKTEIKIKRDSKQDRQDKRDKPDKRDNKSNNKSSAREIALKILTDCHVKNAWSDMALRAYLARNNLSNSDSALCARIVYGVLQNQILLDYNLKKFCGRDLKKLDLTVLDILRIGAYQILFLDRVPDWAAVHEAVNLAKKSGYASAAGLVNAVLRKVSDNKENIKNNIENNELYPADSIERLSIKYSCPEWMIEKFIELLGQDEAEEFLKFCNIIPPIYIQANLIKIDDKSLCAELQAAGMDIKLNSWLAGCLEARGNSIIKLSDTGKFTGKFFVQDPAARLVTILGGVKSNMSVLDVCAAPGGKSFGAAIDMRNQGEILACDINAKRLKLIQDGAARLGFNIIKTARADGREFHPEWEKRFDMVLVDAPCSGLGILRKKPDIRYKYKDLKDLKNLIEIQKEILNNAANYVKPGGRIVYSTCSILPEENQRVTDEFLKRRTEFQADSFAAEYPGIDNNNPGQVTLWPQRNQTDGFYIRVMTRIK